MDSSGVIQHRIVIELLRLTPFCAALVLTAVFLRTDESPKWKATAAIVFVLSTLFQFVLPVHFIIPLLMQVVLSIALLFYFRLW